MITVKFVRDDRRRITGVFMNGHAGYAPEGEDIVCAGASVLLYTMINSLERITGLDAEKISNIVEDGEAVNAEVIIPEAGFADEAGRERAQVILETIYTGFISLASSVNIGDERYIRITEDN